MLRARRHGIKRTMVLWSCAALLVIPPAQASNEDEPQDGALSEVFTLVYDQVQRAGRLVDLGLHASG